jgi:uncharacterized protein (UPF0262 family)
MAEPATNPQEGRSFRIAKIDLDEKLILRHSADVEHERRVAIFDLLEENYFHPAGSDGGPYNVVLGVEENRLSFDIKKSDGSHFGKVVFSLTPLRKIVKDYFMVCESYYNAIKTATSQQIEAIDMGRRSLHNEGSELLKKCLEGKIDVDFDTARRLFTLICVLHIKG